MFQFDVKILQAVLWLPVLLRKYWTGSVARILLEESISAVLWINSCPTQYLYRPRKVGHNRSMKGLWIPSPCALEWIFDRTEPPFQGQMLICPVNGKQRTMVILKRWDKLMEGIGVVKRNISITTFTNPTYIVVAPGSPIVHTLRNGKPRTCGPHMYLPMWIDGGPSVHG